MIGWVTFSIRANGYRNEKKEQDFRLAEENGGDGVFEMGGVHSVFGEFELAASVNCEKRTRSRG